MRTSQQQEALFTAAIGLTLGLGPGTSRTAEAPGEDVEGAGESTQETAEDVEDEL